MVGACKGGFALGRARCTAVGIQDFNENSSGLAPRVLGFRIYRVKGLGFRI